MSGAEKLLLTQASSKPPANILLTEASSQHAVGESCRQGNRKKYWLVNKNKHRGEAELRTTSTQHNHKKHK